ncbi:MAG: ice-binding family protein, partial [Thermoanaerobaculia bacterium]
MKRFSLRVPLCVVLVSMIFVAAPVWAQAPPLNDAAPFAVLGASTVTNVGPSLITGELGVSPGASVTGFPPGLVVGGTFHLADAVAADAQTSANNAYVTLQALPCPLGNNLTGQDLGTLAPLVAGVYCFDTSAQLTGALVLDAEGVPTAEWIFQTGSTLTTASAATVTVINGGNDCNVYWALGSSATLGTGTQFAGNILAQTSITLTTGANVSGRLLALTGA